MARLGLNASLFAFLITLLSGVGSHGVSAQDIDPAAAAANAAAAAEAREEADAEGETETEAEAEPAPDAAPAPAAEEVAPSEGAPPDLSPEGAAAAANGETTPEAPASTPDAPNGEADVPAPPRDVVAPPVEAPAPIENRLRLVAVDSATYGIDAVVGQFVDRTIRELGAEMGYELVPRAATVAAAQRLRMPYPPAPADLWRATYVARAHRGIFAKVWAHEGRYVTEVMVASVDGGGPFFARATSGNEDLGEAVTRLIRETLPLATQWDAAAAQQHAQGQAQPSRAPVMLPPMAAPQTRLRRLPAVRRRSTRPTRRFDIALQTEAAFGVGSDFFYNHLFGARLGFRITTNSMLGLYVGYANLRGRDGRAGNMLMYLQYEQRLRPSGRSDISIPLRAAIGYVPFNGPFFRLAAGINIPLSSRVEIAFDILNPTFWILPNSTAVSFDVAAEMIFRL